MTNEAKSPFWSDRFSITIEKDGPARGYFTLTRLYDGYVFGGRGNYFGEMDAIQAAVRMYDDATPEKIDAWRAKRRIEIVKLLRAWHPDEEPSKEKIERFLSR